MTWKHDRGIKPLLAANEAFKKIHPNVQIDWDARSLQDFERYPLDLLAKEYDLIMIDHPHIGTAVKQKLLLPLSNYLSEDFLEDQKKNSVGLSYSSYEWEGEQWALAVDAAAQVSAYRKDLLSASILSVPKNWSEVQSLIKELPKGVYIGLPLVPVHAFASFFTLCSQISKQEFWSDETDLNIEAGEQAINILQEILPVLHPQSLNSDPIIMSEHMANTNEIAYVPLMYGYSNYAQNGFASNGIHFGNIPFDEDLPTGSMIGGVGLAISAQCVHINIVIDYLKMTADGEFQSTTFFQNGGQPGHRSAWRNEEVNFATNDFFRNTLQTLDYGSMRPRFDGYIEFQEKAGTMIRDFLMEGRTDRKDLIQQLNIQAKKARK
ncbi:ABC transporter substrate-binding protein [Paenibacillus abyssi]